MNYIHEEGRDERERWGEKKKDRERKRSAADLSRGRERVGSISPIIMLLTNPKRELERERESASEREKKKERESR